MDAATDSGAPALAYPVEDGAPPPGGAVGSTLGLTESFLDVAGEGVVVSAIKRAEAADEREGGTRLVMTHSGLPDVTERDSHRAGWTGAMAKLTDRMQAEAT